MLRDHSPEPIIRHVGEHRHLRVEGASESFAEALDITSLQGGPTIIGSIRQRHRT